MVPAMDRVQKTLALRSWLGFGLGLALSLTDLGCAWLPWHRQTPEPPMLGRMSDTTDIYAMSRRPDSPTFVPGPAPTGMAADIQAPVPGSNSIATPAEFNEVGVAMRPAETAATPASGAVALQAPTPMDARPAPRALTAAAGVPNASLVLASAERRAVASPSRQAADLVAEARAALDAMTNYEVSLHRQERVNGTLLPEEDVLVAIRREPRAVRLSWPTGPNQGREVLYRADEPGGPMHVKMANPALPRMTLQPESPMVMRNSRHPVTEAGLDSIVEGLENALKGVTPSDITYAGTEAVEGIDQPQPCLTRTSPSGDRWRIYFDPKTHLPSLILATDASGELLERYLFRDVRPNLPELTASEAFDANARWGPQRGLFSRLGRAESTEPSPTPR